MAAALPPEAGAASGSGRPRAAGPDTGLQYPAAEDTWQQYHEERIRLLDTLTPSEMFDVLVFVSGSAPEAVYEALCLVKPKLAGRGMMP